MSGQTWVFLRSAHAGESERNGPPPSPDLALNPDMWTQLFAEIIRRHPGTHGVIARVGESYDVEYEPGLVERRMPDLTALRSLNPDVVINRGGYREYLRVESTPEFQPAIHVYLGCGARYNPAAWSWLARLKFDIILVDSPAQRGEVAAASPDATVAVFHKPAHEGIFKPVRAAERFDICFSCHRPIEFKGCPWLASRIPDGTRVLRIGPEDQWFAAERDRGRLDVTFTGLIPRPEVPGWARQATMGAVCDDGQKDSGPRVLPEFLAMDMPVLVRDTVRTDLAAYVVPETGLIVDDAGPFAFRDAFEFIRANRGTFQPRSYYCEHFTLAQAASRIRNLIQEARASKSYRLLTKREPTKPDMEIVERRCCPVCGAVGGHVYAAAEHSRVLDGKATWLECPGCQLVYQPWFYRLPELTDLFKRTPAPYRRDSKIDGYDLHFDEKCPGHRNRLKRFTSRCGSGSLVVELGFGGGILLNLLTDSAKWDRVAGIEIVHRYVEHARRCGFDAYWADVSLQRCDALYAQANLVIASEVIEHVEEPVRFLAGARTLLAPGGIVAVSFAVPDKREKLSASEWQYWRKPSIVKAIELAGYSAESSEIQFGSTLAYAWLRQEADCG